MQAIKIWTPPLSSGCVSGTMRRWLLDHQPLPIEEKEITQHQLQGAEHIFLTNAIQGIRWVKSIRDTSYQKSPKMDELINAINLFI